MSVNSWNLPPLRVGYPASADLVARRVRAAGASGDIALETQIGGVRCLTVGGATTDRTILYLHGGGYRMGRPEAWVTYAGRIAAATKAQVVMPDYRLAPEHPFPAGLHDAVAVCEALQAQGPVIVAGDSAGGGLAAALAIAAHETGRTMAGAILVSPMLDLLARDETYVSRSGSDVLFSRDAVLECADLYLQGHAPDDPLASAIHADPAAFPPVLLLAGGGEVLLGETLTFARRLALADRRVSLHVAPGMGHVWPMLAPDGHEAAEAFAAMGAFVHALFA